MNAPSPTLTSSTIASAPPAIFFDMIEEAISGRMSTVAGDVAEAVELLVRRDEVVGLADDRQPDLLHLGDERRRRRGRR